MMLKQQTSRDGTTQKAFILLIAGILISVASAGPVITFNDNGAWCWYQDERVIVNDGKLIIGSVADSSGTGGSTRNGDIEVVTYDIALGGTPDRFTLHDALEGDDHAAPAFLVRPDGRILAVYAKHGSDNYIRYRITTNPNDTSAWNSELTHNRGVGVTYSNVYRLSAENGGSGRIYDFYRGENYNPNFVTSDDNGQTWTYGLPGVSTDGRLIAIGTGGTRPYVKYTSNNVDKIHFITTEGHPRNYNNSIYYGYLYDGDLYEADGTWLHDTADGGIAPQDLEKIYQGGSDNVAWTTDIELDADGNPYFAFSIQMNQDMYDLRYGYARWDGSQWHVNEIAYAGTCLYSAEDDYTGLVALDPQDPNVLYISTDANPYTGSPLISSADGQRHYELFKGTTTDMGVTWTWDYITKNSSEDNIRPIVPIWDDPNTILLWMKGTYYSYTSWDMDIVGMIAPEPVESNEPEIIYQPLSTGVPLGETAMFDVYATSPLPMSYAWYKVNPGGSDIPVGGNSDVLTISDVEQSDAGQYYCVVTNTAGSATSSNASLMIADLDAYWPLDGNYNDVTGNGYNATPVGSPSFVDGYYGQAVNFNGSSYLNCQNSSVLTLKDGGTVTAWIKSSGLGSNVWASVVTKGRWSWRLCRNDNTDFLSFHFNSPNYEFQANGDIDVVDNDWHFVAATYDGQSIALYIDGQLDASSMTTEAVNELTDPVYIGNRSDASRYWIGQIDDVRIYSFAMNEDLIQLLYEGKSCYKLDPYDLDEDCHIGLGDLDMFCTSWPDSGNLYEYSEIALKWLDCYLLPTSDCE
ncbi:MAG: BNR-4 repeat-containing protein [Sedimentisphaerales bacterium]|nr:BNR-4 repeat-containing protein [Sedimentisphaerales bacterium]